MNLLGEDMVPVPTKEGATNARALGAFVDTLAGAAAVFEEQKDGFVLLVANAYFLKVIGQKAFPSDSLGPDAAAVFAPAAAPHIYAGLLRASRCGEGVDVTVQLGGEDVRWRRFTFVPLANQRPAEPCRVLCTTIDVTAKYSAYKASELMRTNLENFVKSNLEGIISCSEDGTIVRFNEAAEQIFGYDREEIIGQSINVLIPVEVAARHDRYLASFAGSPDISRKMQSRAPLSGLRQDGTKFAAEISISKTKVDDEVMFTAMIRDETDRLEVVEKLRREANTDFLTKLHNRRSFDKRLVREVARANRYGRPLSILALDIDDFKRVNDTLGHDAGDSVLKSIAAVLIAECREHDICARTGGEELCILMPETKKKAAIVIAERLCRLIEACAIIPDWPVTVSIGCARLRKQDTPQSLAVRADEKLYEAKAAGKNRVCA